ncbi:hypothetical protein [Rhizobium leguminosarum]|uniref:hypothetical protein n=1 Tax=Rhizobium leguminosarum TaxID=384 RepID=UPI002E0EFAD6|nr:hypothetical protein U8Q02_05910 [Rhizobium leguminosarum]
MKVFIANFGRENYAWPDCLARGAIATMNDIEAQRFWEAGDREGYLSHTMKGKTAAGYVPTRPVASRWYNLMTIVSEARGDLWIHREKDRLWWTTSKDVSPTYERRVEPVGVKNDVVICYKPCEPWSNVTRRGLPLDWNALHGRSREFLFTESTLQQLSSDNAEYALALISGDDLSPWHGRPDWQAKATKKGAPVKTFNPREKAIARMAMTAKGTASFANGQLVERKIKNKEVLIPDNDFEPYIGRLIDEQRGNCALSGLPLQFDGACIDPEMLCSLDRIDSNKHYEYENLQVVCKFINRWKGADNNEEFKRLLNVFAEN